MVSGLGFEVWGLGLGFRVWGEESRACLKPTEFQS